MKTRKRIITVAKRWSLLREKRGRKRAYGSPCRCAMEFLDDDVNEPAAPAQAATHLSLFLQPGKVLALGKIPCQWCCCEFKIPTSFVDCGLAYMYFFQR